MNNGVASSWLGEGGGVNQTISVAQQYCYQYIGYRNRKQDCYNAIPPFIGGGNGHPRLASLWIRTWHGKPKVIHSHKLAHACTLTPTPTYICIKQSTTTNRECLTDVTCAL